MSHSIPVDTLTPLILAGGFGTRLRTMTGNTPKVLVDIQGRPFILYLLDQLEQAGFRHVLISIGYGADQVISTLGHHHRSLDISYCKENQPLGTGGALRFALEFIKCGAILAMNGDSIVNMPLRPFVDMALTQPESPALVAVKVNDIVRFGSLAITGGIVDEFREKGQDGQGWINAGIYYFPRSIIAQLTLGKPASLEKDVLEKQRNTLRAFQCKSDFIDIGTPESYTSSQLLQWLDKIK